MTLVENSLRRQKSLWLEIIETSLGLAEEGTVPARPKRILLFGLGSSHYAARLCATALLRDKAKEVQRIPILASSSMAFNQEIQPQKDDLVFAFSHRGKSTPTLKALNFCNQAGAHTVLVASRDCPHPGEDSIHTFLPTTPLEPCEPHTMSVTGAVCAVTTLLMGNDAADEWKALAARPDPDLNEIKDRAQKGPSIILGEWEGEWLAREAALKLMEMARIPVRVFGSEEYFHGPRYCTHKEDKLWHLAVPKDSRTREILPQLRLNIQSSSPLGWVPALLELQWLALGVALNNKKNPDEPETSET